MCSHKVYLPDNIQFAQSCLKLGIPVIDFESAVRPLIRQHPNSSKYIPSPVDGLTISGSETKFDVGEIYYSDHHHLSELGHQMISHLVLMWLRTIILQMSFSPTTRDVVDPPAAVHLNSTVCNSTLSPHSILLPVVNNTDWAITAISRGYSKQGWSSTTPGSKISFSLLSGTTNKSRCNGLAVHNIAFGYIYSRHNNNVSGGVIDVYVNGLYVESVDTCPEDPNFLHTIVGVRQFTNPYAGLVSPPTVSFAMSTNFTSKCRSRAITVVSVSYTCS